MITDAMIEANYWSDCQTALGYETTWSIWEVQSVDTKLLTDRPRLVTYKIYAKDASVEELMGGTATEIVLKTTAKSGSVRDLWEAAETVYKKSKALGDWHTFVEDFHMEDDGSLTLCMGS
jgi:hypothetical protein